MKTQEEIDKLLDYLESRALTDEQMSRIDISYGRSLAQGDEIRSLSQQVEQLTKQLKNFISHKSKLDMIELEDLEGLEHPEQPSPQERTCETCSNQSFNETHGCINYNQWFACKNWQPKPQEYISGIDAPGRDASWGAIVRAKCSAPARSLGNGKCVYISAMTGVDAKIDDIDFEGYWSYHNAVLPSDEQLSKFVPKPQEESDIIRKAADEFIAATTSPHADNWSFRQGARWAIENLKEGWQREAFNAGKELHPTKFAERKWKIFEDWNRDKASRVG